MRARVRTLVAADDHPPLREPLVELSDHRCELVAAGLLALPTDRPLRVLDLGAHKAAATAPARAPASFDEAFG